MLFTPHMELKPEDSKIAFRREVVFMLLAGIFLGTLAMLNILGISRFIDFSFDIGGISVPFVLAVGVLPYPITFLCTDLISELYGRKRANMVVWIGLVLNVWVLFVLWIGGVLDAPENLTIAERLVPMVSAEGLVEIPYGYAFYEIRYLSFGATFASMVAYLTAQFVDVHVFHWVKKTTNGKMLWLRNNISTLVSQLVDSVAVVLITHLYADALPKDESGELIEPLIVFILSGYIFKVIAALMDTLPFYVLVHYLSMFLKIDHKNVK
ncbi:MAG: queuosine precursor transporter [Flavobacteriales bacterium]